jgi:hypothetical protein
LAARISLFTSLRIDALDELTLKRRLNEMEQDKRKAELPPVVALWTSS